jgi:hypothetical protein
MARPTKFTEEAIRKIEEVAALDGSVEEMAYYAGVHVDSVYTWLKANKEFSDRIKALRERPILKARQTVVKSLETPEGARWYLARKKKKEFAERIETDITTKGEKIILSAKDQALMDEFEGKLKEGL